MSRTCEDNGQQRPTAPEKVGGNSSGEYRRCCTTTRCSEKSQDIVDRQQRIITATRGSGGACRAAFEHLAEETFSFYLAGN
mmetsp:Transcript_46589/g.92659  ORF Transcript_46589/g.92659 Transcript_46589/m.92659 type:complete len:81 (+) Transcript_46589:89-331(+)